jgi:hypothetical protein
MITRTELTQLARTALKNDLVTFESNVDNTSDWDSLGQLSLLIVLDRATNGRSSELVELPACTSLKQVFDILKKNNLAEE